MDELRARPATRTQAEAVLKLVEAKYASWLVTWPVVDGRIDFDSQVPVADTDRPHIVEHWGDDDATVIAWENNAPTDWALHPLTEAHVDEELASQITEFVPTVKRAAHLATVEGAEGSLPKGVYTDAYFSFVLAVYQEV
jgi:hypothetical protein